MNGSTRKNERGRRIAVVALTVAALVAGVAVARDLYGDATTPAAAATTTMQMKTGTSSSSGMSMPMPVPMQTLGTANWQGMKIIAQASTPVPFVVFSGTSERMVKPSMKDSMHLMVKLMDAQTGMAIPYASVWATIRKGSTVVYDARQWPMISRYMGSHYGNDVALPGKGSYQLSLLISPPQSARHMEYAKVWLKPHRVTMAFTWKGKG
ncbi:MAG TPA: iron transporter [Gaiellaceae bacterium]|nr:iron transporter [Gaiellaceae bacterium]